VRPEWGKGIGQMQKQLGLKLKTPKINQIKVNI
jgi:hypothetical protein